MLPLLLPCSLLLAFSSAPGLVRVHTVATPRAAAPRLYDVTGPLAEDQIPDWDDDELPAGMTVHTQDAATLEAFSPGGVLSDVDDLLSDWQEEIAIADDGLTPPSASDQEAMMRRWRILIETKEKDLRRTRRRELREAYDSTWAPAHLAGWWTSEDGGRETDDDAPLEPEAVDAVLEAEAEGADEADAAFVAAWQTHAERERETRARQTARSELAQRVTPEEARQLASWLFQGLQPAARAAATSAEPAIGIDLGTTNCACAAVGSNGKPFLIPAADGARVSPSVVSYVATPAAAADELPAPLLSPLGAANSTRVLVGARAQRQWVTNPHSTYASTKRLIGRTASSAELRALAALDVPHSVSGGGQEREVLLACPALRRALSPVDAAAELVRALVGQAEAALAHKVRRAVVTVPAYFDDGQRLATETACMLSGLEEVKLLREPEAVFDLGGGTFDVSILDVGAGVVEVIASAGDPRLGGDDWDRTIQEWLEDEFVREHGVPLDGFARRRLLDAAEEAKLRLSSSTSTQVEVPFLVGARGLNVTLSRRKFEALCRPLLLRLVPPMREAAKMAGVELDESNWGTLARGDTSHAPKGVQQWRQQVAWRWRRMAQRAGSTSSAFPLGDVPISKVLLVGGSTRMPCIGRFIKRVTGLPGLPDQRVNPDEAVALGAAVMAGVLDGSVKQHVLLRNPYQHERAASRLADDVSTFGI